MKIKDGFILRSVAGTDIVVAIGKESESFGKMIKLNDSAAFLFRCLASDKSAQELAQALVTEYDISMELATKDVESFVSTMKAAGLIV